MKLEAVKYIFAGAFNTALGLSCIFIGLYYFGLNDVEANLFGYGIGLISAFTFNRLLIFKSNHSVKKSFTLFIVVFLVSYALNIITMLTLHRGLNVNVYLSQLAGIFVYTLTGFLGNYYYAFAKK